MKISRLALSAALFCGIAANAEARRNPTPPPSGVVVHLFGPNSVMGNITPERPTGEVSTPGMSPPQEDADDPTMGAILHQMFVVGDPGHPNKPAPGRAAERRPAGN